MELQLDTGQTGQSGGYAAQMDEQFYAKQRQMMIKVVGESDVVITTAAIPGKKSPVLVTAEMVEKMAPGSVIVDLAAERGGNCELTRANETVVQHGVTIIGPVNLPAEVPYHSSQMYSKNISTFLLHVVRDGQLRISVDDEIVRDTLVAHQGQVVNNRVRTALGLSPLEAGVAATA
jgi:NAD(P) transhydrogenase subunit alpha